MRLLRLRKYLLLVLALLLVYELRGFTFPFNSHKHEQALELAYLFISMLGLTIRFITVGYATKRSLNTRGMYSITRNPVYLANFTIMLGFMLFPRSLMLIVVYFALMAMYYSRLIGARESRLRDQFGDEFAAWAEAEGDKIPVFYPDFRLWKKPEGSFAWKRAIKREYGPFFTIISLYMILEAASDLAKYSGFDNDPMWFYIFIFGLVIYAPIRILDKLTKFFDR